MPVSAPKICSKAGCNTLTLKGRCDAHQYDKGKDTAQQRQAKRKYATNDPRWRLIRKRQLSKQPLCQACNDAGQLTPAKVVDHIDGDSFNNQPDNLASMCWSCHSRKTAQQDHGFGNA
jgi:5-methylcytosine-specific restriction protein A